MMEEKLERWYKCHGRKAVIVLGIIFGIYLVWRLNIIGLFAPFIVAWIFAIFLNPFVTWANRQLKIPRGIGTIFSMLTILSGILALLWAIMRKLWEQIVNFTTMLPSNTDKIIAQLNSLEIRMEEGWPSMLGEPSIPDLDTLIKQFMDGFSSFLSSAVPVAYDVAAKVPDVFLFIIAMLLATFFMTKDYKKIKDFVKAQFSDTIVDKIVIMQRGMIEAIGGYIRTQLILMSITFSISFVGLVIFGVDYALLLAVIIAIVDALPVFGSGTILIPWGIYQLLVGNYTLAIGLLCIYGIIFVARQILEPRILSSQIGVYALVTLMSVYIGYKLLGFIGLILGPAIVVILQMLQNVGALPKFKPVKRTEGDCNEKHTDSSNQQSS